MFNFQYTISINVVNQLGELTYYDEQCAALTASVYLGSSGIADAATKELIHEDEALANEEEISGIYGTLESFILLCDWDTNHLWDF